MHDLDLPRGEEGLATTLRIGEEGLWTDPRVDDPLQSVTSGFTGEDPGPFRRPGGPFGAANRFGPFGGF
jgi:hypothetical protein